MAKMIKDKFYADYQPTSSNEEENQKFDKGIKITKRNNSNNKGKPNSDKSCACWLLIKVMYTKFYNHLKIIYYIYINMFSIIIILTRACVVTSWDYILSHSVILNFYEILNYFHTF